MAGALLSSNVKLTNKLLTHGVHVLIVERTCLPTYAGHLARTCCCSIVGQFLSFNSYPTISYRKKILYTNFHVHLVNALH